MRWAVVGDIGGHLHPLVAELTRLGVDVESATIPEDLTVVQVGDLIHRGPDSAGVIRLVDRLIGFNPGRWLQLVGNHEAQYLRKPAFVWRERLDDDSADVLRRWWDEGTMLVAAVVPTQNGDMLVTHAGVTERFWYRDLGAPHSAHHTAELLNHPAVRRDAEALFRPGVMLTGDINPRVGPIWADAGSELLPSWGETRLPFGQVHGHSSLLDWTTGSWNGVLAETRERTLLDLVACHETTMLNGGSIVGIDPGHSSGPRARWHAWEPLPA